MNSSTSRGVGPSPNLASGVQCEDPENGRSAHIDISLSEKIIGKVMQADSKEKGRWILPVSRRRFVKGLAAGGVLAAFDWGGRQAFGETGQQQTPATLTGKDLE